MNDHELRGRSWKLALGLLLTAAAAGVMVLDNLIGVSMFISPILAALLLVPVLHQCGSWPAVGSWAVCSALSVWLVENPITSGLFFAFGYYPILRPLLQRLPSRYQRFSVKFGYFNVFFSCPVCRHDVRPGPGADESDFGRRQQCFSVYRVCSGQYFISAIRFCRVADEQAVYQAAAEEVWSAKKANWKGGPNRRVHQEKKNIEHAAAVSWTAAAFDWDQRQALLAWAISFWKMGRLLIMVSKLTQ